MRKNRQSLNPTHPAIERARWVANLMDSAITIPVVRWKIGLDPLLGLLPVSGELLSALLSLYLVVVAYQLSLPRHIMVRMGLNIILDLLLGLLPVVGDITDFFWKSNRYNLKLLEEAYRQYGVETSPAGGIIIDVAVTAPHS